MLRRMSKRARVTIDLVRAWVLVLAVGRLIEWISLLFIFSISNNYKHCYALVYMENLLSSTVRSLVISNGLVTGIRGMGWGCCSLSTNME